MFNLNNQDGGRFLFALSVILCSHMIDYSKDHDQKIQPQKVQSSKKPKKKNKSKLDGDSIDGTFDVNAWLESMSKSSEEGMAMLAKAQASMESYDCIIVGAGLSGLQCARSLIDHHNLHTSKILVIEARSSIRGPFASPTLAAIRSDAIFNSPINIRGSCRFFNICPTATGGYVVKSAELEELTVLLETIEQLGLMQECDIPLESSLLSHFRGAGLEAEQIRLGDALFKGVAHCSADRLSLRAAARIFRAHFCNSQSFSKVKSQLNADFMTKLQEGLNIEYDTPVTEVDYTRGWAANPAPGLPHKPILIQTKEGKVTYKTKTAVIAVPSKALKDGVLSFSPPFPKYKLDAMQGIDVNPVIAVVLKFSSRLLLDGIETLVMSSEDCFFSTIRFFEVADDPTHFFAGALVAGSQATMLHGKPLEEINLLLLRLIDAVAECMDHSAPRPSSVYSQGFVFDWSREQFLDGGFISKPPGYRFEDHSILSKPFGAGNSGKVFFCGDYTSENLFTLSPASASLQTGRSAADQVVQFLRKT